MTWVLVNAAHTTASATEGRVFPPIRDQFRRNPRQDAVNTRSCP
jgi:hypothetical protein